MHNDNILEARKLIAESQTLNDKTNVKVKTCRRCKQEKPIEQFSLRRRASDGHTFWCKDCSKQYHREYKERVIDNGINKE